MIKHRMRMQWKVVVSAGLRRWTMSVKNVHRHPEPKTEPKNLIEWQSRRIFLEGNRSTYNGDHDKCHVTQYRNDPIKCTSIMIMCFMVGSACLSFVFFLYAFLPRSPALSLSSIRSKNASLFSHSQTMCAFGFFSSLESSSFLCCSNWTRHK